MQSASDKRAYVNFVGQFVRITRSAEHAPAQAVGRTRGPLHGKVTLPRVCQADGECTRLPHLPHLHLPRVRRGGGVAVNGQSATPGALRTLADGRGLVWGWVGRNNQLKQHDDAVKVHHRIV
jgi:hypothetical protein